MAPGAWDLVLPVLGFFGFLIGRPLPGAPDEAPVPRFVAPFATRLGRLLGDAL